MVIASAMVVGCVVGKSNLGDVDDGPSDAGADDAAPDGDEDDADDDDDDSAEGPGAEGPWSGESTDGGPDEGTAGTGGPEDPTGGPAAETGPVDPGDGHHASCDLPFPEVAPELPQLNTLPDGTPAFTGWENLSCDDPAVAAVTTCAEGCDGNSQCSGDEAGGGVCTSWDIDVWCDGEGQATGYLGECVICMGDELHARGCCDYPDIFDCRAWPFAGTSGPNQICATHDDCEDGLVCADPYASGGNNGWGVCRCPGETGNIDQEPFCFGLEGGSDSGG